MALLEARGLVKQYGRRTVVDGVDLDVNAGEIVGLLGPNGAGKTTTFRMVVGMIAPKSGRVSFNGRDVTHRAMYQRARLGLGYLAQDSSVFRRLTVEQNLLAVLELMTTRRGQPFRSNARQRRERADELLEQFHIAHLRKSMAMNLSGGERRRLEIARCLVSEPMLIMLDEPFTGIDPKTVGDIQEIVRGLCNKGIGVLITDHHVRETLKITNRSYLIAEGKVLTHGTAVEIVRNKDARERYLGHSFDDGGIASVPYPADAPAARAALVEDGPAHSLRFLEQLRDWIANLNQPSWPAYAERIRAAGPIAIPELMQAMQWRDLETRGRAHALLCAIAGREFPFDPASPEGNRLKQLVAIRESLDQRRAG